MADEALHEIQLNGKQLVFLFMSATVVAVVVFLCGVMVGRGVSAQRGELMSVAGQAIEDPTAARGDFAPSAATARPEGASASSQESLSYPDRLAADTVPPETLKEEVAQVVVAASPVAPSRPGSEWTVQVAAVREASEAERMAQRLTAKGYAAYVNAPAIGTPRVYRVRIGHFADRREAETVASRLEKEEQFKPWITR